MQQEAVPSPLPGRVPLRPAPALPATGRTRSTLFFNSRIFVQIVQHKGDQGDFQFLFGGLKADRIQGGSAEPDRPPPRCGCGPTWTGPTDCVLACTTWTIRPVVRLGNGLGQIHFLKGQEQTIAEGLQIQPLSPPRIHYRTDNIWKTITENRINKKIGTVKSSDFTNEYTQTGSVSLISSARNPYSKNREKRHLQVNFGTAYKTSLVSHPAIPFVSPPVSPIRQHFPIPAPIS